MAPAPCFLLPLLLAGLTGLAGCRDSRDSFRQGFDEGYTAARGGGPPGMVEAPQAISLLGEELHSLSLDSAEAAPLEARLDSAEAAYEAEPDSAEALVWLGRRLAYTGRYRDAIDAFTEGIGRFPDDARFYRHRGHRYITVRELDRAIEDLEHAARLTGGQDDEVEPDGMPNEAGIPRSTLQTNIWYHLGLARYLKGDFEGAIHAFRLGLDASPNDDMRVAMADWLWMALMRLDRTREAEELLTFVRPEMDILENDAYHRRLLLYKGLLPADSLMPDPSDADDLQLATYGYGLGNWYLVNGDREKARRTFEAVVDTGYWPAFGHIAAEAELARWPDQDGG